MDGESYNISEMLGCRAIKRFLVADRSMTPVFPNEHNLQIQVNSTYRINGKPNRPQMHL